MANQILLDSFRRRLTWIATHMRFVTLDMVLGAIERGHRLPRRPVLLTFDDGLLNNIEFALPAMREHNVRPVFFIPTEPLDHPSGLLWYERLGFIVGWAPGQVLNVPSAFGKGLPISTPAQRESSNEVAFDMISRLTRTHREEVLLELNGLNKPATPQEETHSLFYKHMTWEQLKGISGEWVDVGGHTETHAALSRMSDEESTREVRENMQRLFATLGVKPAAFAYPFGSRDFFGEREENIVREAGYRIAFSSLSPHKSADARFAMPRRNVYKVSFDFSRPFSPECSIGRWLGPENNGAWPTLRRFLARVSRIGCTGCSPRTERH
ncbi:MAG: polysaccharide deacetylase family protein [Planctomycetes bacterium]|nr:polysaccharide deacetylase family protein [Planctomycetota bacterium]